MIEQLTMNKKTNYASLLRFITAENNYDFYYTENNERFFVTDIPSLKKFLKVSRFIYVKEEDGEYKGLIMLWKSIGGGTERYYLKIHVRDEKTARDLITVLLWNTSKEIFAKFRKDNRVVSVLRNKGFRFLGGRGVQVLMSKKPTKEQLDARRNPSYNRDKDSIYSE